MTNPSDELLPIVTVSLFDRTEIEGLVFSALDGSVALVPVADLPDGGTSFVLELRSPDHPKPLLLAGELAGEPAAGFCPMFLRPVDSTNADELLTFLGSVSSPPEQLEEVGPRSVRAHMRILTPRVSLPQMVAPTDDSDRRAMLPPLELPDLAPMPGTPDARSPHKPGRSDARGATPKPGKSDPRGLAPKPLLPEGAGVGQYRSVPARHAAAPGREDSAGRDASSGRAGAASGREAAGREPSGRAAAPPVRESGKSAITLQSIPGSHPSDAPPAVQVIATQTPEPPSHVTAPVPAPPPAPPPADARIEAKSAVTLDGDGARSSSSGPPSVTRDPLLGRSLGGKYTISALIGAGGAGSVYRARHVMLQKDIAIKVMHPSLRKDPTFGARFHAEALAASKLDHPNVLRVLDFGEEPDGLLYIAMELLVGTELRALLWQGRMPLPRALDITCQICAALSAASEVGIVHRDIKPENVVITSSRDDEGDTVDLVKVCDFGLAQIVKSGTSGEHRASSYIAGTPEYMSPEQVRGEELDGRSDIYAVGIVLYELLTGRVPFEGEVAVEILRAHLTKPVVVPSKVAKDVDPEVEAVVLRALSKDRHQRPATAREVRAELRTVLERLRRPTPPANTPAPAAVPLEDPASGFGELFVALTTAVAHTAYYERDHVTPAGPQAAPSTGALRAHPELARSLVRLWQATRTPLAGRGEITIAQRDAELVVQTGAGEALELRRVVPGGVAEGYGARLADLFVRRHVVSFTLREGVIEADLADATEMLSGPDVSPDALRLDFLSRGLPGVSILFTEEMLGKSRKLPWHVDLCVSRLARDLRAIPLFRGVTEEAMRALRVQLVADVVRSLERPEDIRMLLENTDLVATSVAHIPELDALDLKSVIVTALRKPLAVASARHLLTLAGRATPAPSAVDTRPPIASPRALLGPFASRFLRERSPETDDLLRSMLGVRVIDLSDLPRELQLVVAADRLASAMASDPELLFKKLSAAHDLTRFADEIAAASRALAALAKAGDARTVAGAVAGLTALARGAPPGDASKEGLAASAVSSLGDETALAALADAVLFGPIAQREPARTVLAQLGAGSRARAPLGARARSRPRALPAAPLRRGAPRGRQGRAPGHRRAPLAHGARERGGEQRGRRRARGGSAAGPPRRAGRVHRPRRRPLPPPPHAGGASRRGHRAPGPPGRARQAVAHARAR